MKYPTVTIRTDVLESWLKVCGYTKSRLAVELGVSRGRVSQLLSTQREPSAHLIAKMLTVTHMPFDRVFRIVRTSEVPVSSSVSRTKNPTHRLANKLPTEELVEGAAETQLAGGKSSS